MRSQVKWDWKAFNIGPGTQWKVLVHGNCGLISTLNTSRAFLHDLTSAGPGPAISWTDFPWLVRIDEVSHLWCFVGKIYGVAANITNRTPWMLPFQVRAWLGKTQHKSNRICTVLALRPEALMPWPSAAAPLGARLKPGEQSALMSDQRHTWPLEGHTATVNTSSLGGVKLWQRSTT